MKKVDLDVQERKEKGKGEIGRLRKAGFVPAIVYGDNSKGLSVKIDKKILVHFLRAIGNGNVLTNLKIKGEKGISEQLVIIKDTQFDPVREDILHLDFQRVSLTKKIISEVRIILKGEPEGVKAGGMLDHALRTVQVECLPADMPERIEIDISTFKIHDGIHVKDLPIPAGVEMITDMERNVFSILPPRKIEVDEETIKTDEEPEVIGEKGKEEAETAEEAKKEEAGTAEEAKKEEPKKEEEKKGK
ncbi:MAG: 50S ribosomal protein L25 [Candidatus Omnitrophica bacterium]|nr:50S ribosomal protein L25 [Candidatus Omnitrophota bacterium]MBU1047155.1 50S ribosomal protein L25 [Candidatus Omnitrophota bacterium]MBU1631183.1 50S ribosomal protein L25 [Candidatus Omnitrophota bacterium]MBU1767596.1 50S ribosomal protein L25 [Candidatus Omnitrophota bacterium]MBU1889567.1 50S ribosomal protein L25 [Candidatus Omnitrophota bacterium]